MSRYCSGLACEPLTCDKDGCDWKSRGGRCEGHGIQLVPVSVVVDTDMLQQEGFKGSLKEFACYKLSYEINRSVSSNVVTIESHTHLEDVKPDPKERSSWYIKTVMELTAYVLDNGYSVKGIIVQN